MAIQNRRGVYTDFTPSKMVPGELAVVQSGDPNNTSGKAVYAAFGSSGDVKRLATEDDLNKKVDVETGKGLSTNDYTTEEKNKLNGIEAQANKTVLDATLTQTGKAADAKVVGDELTDIKNDLNSKIDAITEHTYNIFNPNSIPIITFGADIEYLGNDIKIISTMDRLYTVAVFEVNVSGINNIFINPYTYEGDGLPAIRVGTINADQTAIDRWLGVSDPQNGSIFNVADYDVIGVGLYARYNTGIGVPGEYITYKNILITSGEEEKPFIPYYSAVDINLRNKLESEGFKGVTIDVVDKSLAHTDLWEAGTINVNSGDNVVQANSIRLINYVAVDNNNPLYLQAYYVLPSDLISVADSDNYNMRNLYIFQYDKDGKYLSRITITSANTLSGYNHTLASQCKYIRIAIYTRLVNTVISDIMPSTIYIDSVNSDYWLPPYYDDYLINKATAIEQYARSSAAMGNVFVFITDQHAPRYNQMRSPFIIRRLAELTHLPIIFCGGDVDQNGTMTYVYCDALRDNFHGEIHHAVGNHDFLSENTGIDLYYDMDIYNKNQIGNREHHYYYVDDVQRKTRYIVLAAYKESEKAEGTGEGTAAQGGYTSEQIAWINNEALNMPDDYTAIVFTHYFYMINTTTKAATLSYGRAILRSLSANPKVLLAIQGHTHFDRIIKGHDEEAGNLPIIITSCDKNIQHNNEGWTVNRATGTIYEQCFDVIILNKDTRTAHIVRIGGLAENGVNDAVGIPSEERTVTF